MFYNFTSMSSDHMNHPELSVSSDLTAGRPPYRQAQSKTFWNFMTICYTNVTQMTVCKVLTRGSNCLRFQPL